MRKKLIIGLGVLLGLCLALGVLGSLLEDAPATDAPTPSPAPSATRAVAASPTAEPTETPTVAASATIRPTETPEPTVTPLPPTATPQPAPTEPPAMPTVASRMQAPSADASDCDCASGDTLNCADFPPWEAQACYLRCLELTNRDVHGLDRDRDGNACEWDPFQ